MLTNGKFDFLKIPCQPIYFIQEVPTLKDGLNVKEKI